MIRLLEASNEKSTMWQWSDGAQLLALTDNTQVLRVLNANGKCAYTYKPPLTLHCHLCHGGCDPILRPYVHRLG